MKSASSCQLQLNFQIGCKIKPQYLLDHQRTDLAVKKSQEFATVIPLNFIQLANHLVPGEMGQKTHFLPITS